MKRKIKKNVSDYLGWAASRRLFTGAIPLLHAAGAFACSVFRPGPVRSSLDDLVFPSSLKRTISTPCLAWTPDRHRAAEDRTPNLTPSNSLDLQSSWITRPRHRSRSARER
ncbi:uncharacterized protein TNIN_225081 [Trichonephila inaurata madagascariensis]|uniref:Uncharacterized protein n=1 Tax=Trichonephila inaurata madagascariensis TaxID=2747483 RepID=A0A8X6WPG9_9ARAC|nr:uncharacterized protein TNIN_225081 [Trichonephila inaurata madagascariensis]